MGPSLQVNLGPWSSTVRAMEHNLASGESPGVHGDVSKQVGKKTQLLLTAESQPRDTGGQTERDGRRLARIGGLPRRVRSAGGMTGCWLSQSTPPPEKVTEHGW